MLENARGALHHMLGFLALGGIEIGMYLPQQQRALKNQHHNGH